jgi:hypothetical protein
MPFSLSCPLDLKATIYVPISFYLENVICLAKLVKVFVFQFKSKRNANQILCQMLLVTALRYILHSM